MLEELLSELTNHYDRGGVSGGGRGRVRGRGRVQRSHSFRFTSRSSISNDP